MHKRKIGIFNSLILVIIIYITASILGGFIGENIFKLSIEYSDYFRKILVSIFLLIFLFYFNEKPIFDNKNSLLGFLYILIVFIMTLFFNNNFLSFNFKILYIYETLSIGLFEEVLYRGISFYFLNYIPIDHNKKAYFTLYLSSTLFAAAHLTNFFSTSQGITQTIVQIIYAFCLGTIFAICYLTTHNIIFSISAHCISDLTSLMIGGSHSSTYVSLSPINILLILIFVVFTILLNYFILKKVKTF